MGVHSITTRFRLFPACVTFLALLAAPCSVPAHAQSSPGLIATPSFGRPNDTFYLAGGGFTPGQPLTISMFCPDWWHSQYGHWSWTVPVGSGGSFTAFRALVPTPLLVSRTSCVLYARNGENPLGVGVSFHIMDANQPYAPQPLTIRLSFHTLRAGASTIEKVAVRCAPGARLEVTAFDPSLAPRTYSVRLPWTGYRVLQWRSPAQVKKGRVLISARAQLGDLAGQTSAWFQVHSPPSRQSPAGSEG